MRKLSVPRGGGGEKKLGVLAFEVAALMSRAASLWRALGDGAPLARLLLRGDEAASVRLEGVRRLVADDDSALLALALAEVAAACAHLSRAVARLAARCADPLLRRFDALFAALVDGGPAAGDRHGLRYSASSANNNMNKKMDRKARKMQRLVATTAHLCHELDVLAELEQGLRRGLRHHRGASGVLETTRRVARQRQEVERLRAASLYDRTFDYAVRLLARSLFTIVVRIIQIFDLEPINTSNPPCSSSYDSTTSTFSRLSWSNSFVVGNSTQKSMVYPSDDVVTTDTAAHRMRRSKSGKQQQLTSGGDARRFLLSRSKSLKQQLKWPAAAGKHLIGCVLAGSNKSPPVREKWVRGGAGDLPLSFSYVSASSSKDDDHSSSINLQSSQADADGHTNTAKLSTSVFVSSSDNALTNPAPETSLGGAALASHYATLIIFIERLAVAPHEICSDERDALYGMLTDTLRSSLRSRLKPPPSAKKHKRRHWPSSSSSCDCDPVLAAAEWADTVRRILGWLAPLAHNMVRWQAERNFEQRNVASSAAGVMLLQTLHFADRKKTEDAVTELLVALDFLWRYGRELEEKTRFQSVDSGNYEDCTYYGA